MQALEVDTSPSTGPAMSRLDPVFVISIQHEMFPVAIGFQIYFAIIQECVPAYQQDPLLLQLVPPNLSKHSLNEILFLIPTSQSAYSTFHTEPRMCPGQFYH